MKTVLDADQFADFVNGESARFQQLRRIAVTQLEQILVWRASGDLAELPQEGIGRHSYTGGKLVDADVVPHVFTQIITD